jgi:hypothetical protein
MNIEELTCKGIKKEIMETRIVKGPGKNKAIIAHRCLFCKEVSSNFFANNCMACDFQSLT